MAGMCSVPVRGWQRYTRVPWPGDNAGVRVLLGLGSCTCVCSLLDPLWESLGEKMHLLGGQVLPAFVFVSLLLVLIL